MCTASWSVGSGRALLAFNRDERKDRPRALPPKVFERDGVKRLAPIDRQAEGTWIAVNEFGLCAFLLNNYEATESAPEILHAASRGELPIHLTNAPSVSSARDELLNIDLAAYRPFHIGMLSVDGIALFSWDGTKLFERDARFGMLTTSSFRSAEVQGYREQRYTNTLGALANPTFEERRKYHVEQENPDTAFNPLMLREDSETHNVSFVDISRERVVFKYEERVTETFELLDPQRSELVVRI